MECPLCDTTRDDIVWQDGLCRVILVADPDYPGYCRVVWREHVAEMSDLDTASRHHFMDVVFATEQALHDSIRPDKINLASLGNMVPHLHWHVIARFRDDRHFPESVWGREQRPGQPHPVPNRADLAERIAAGLAKASMNH